MADAPDRTGLRAHTLLLARFLKHPRTVGAVAPSSAVLAEAMVRDLDFARARSIVELGPGTGAFTAAIVPRLGPDARFLAIDIEPAFVETIRRQWPAVECICASAEDLDRLAADRGLLPVDHIVSGLPFVSLPTAMTNRILDSITRALRPGGTMTTFQYVHGYALPPAIQFRRNMTARLGTEPRVTGIARNLPPAFVLTWIKAGADIG